VIAGRADVPLSEGTASEVVLKDATRQMA
jgi:hypothetical protein